jgi:integrase
MSNICCPAGARWRRAGKAKAVEHFEALPYAQVPDFLAKLRRRRGRTQQSELTALAIEWTVLTAARYGEVHGCTAPEIDWERRLWTIPAGRMKASREHVVPLTDRLREVYDGAMWRAPTGTDRLFPVSDTAMRRLCRQIAGQPVTIHGFRSSFRDWCAENGVSRDLAEAALAPRRPTTAPA